MPELPEVETVLQGLIPHIQDATIERAIIRTPQLRWPIPELNNFIRQQKIIQISRRGKYLLMRMQTGTLLLHLGMSGRLCILQDMQLPKRHDHVDIIFTNQQVLRYTDPRRFGAILWTSACPLEHHLLKNLGLEPLTDAFTDDYLLQQSNNRRVAI